MYHLSFPIYVMKNIEVEIKKKFVQIQKLSNTFMQKFLFIHLICLNRYCLEDFVFKILILLNSKVKKNVLFVFDLSFFRPMCNNRLFVCVAYIQARSATYLQQILASMICVTDYVVEITKLPARWRTIGEKGVLFQTYRAPLCNVK